MQGPRKAAQLRFRKSPCTVCLPLQPESDRLMLAQLQCHLNCAVDVPQSWSGLQLTMMVSPMATSVKCPVYKQKRKKATPLRQNQDLFFHPQPVQWAPIYLQTSYSTSPFLLSACLSFSLFPQSSEGSFHYFTMQSPTPMILVKGW